MENINICGKSISLRDQDQIINMGGPWVGELFIDDTFITDNCIDNNILVDEESDQFLFVKYHPVSKWQNENFFTINTYNIVTGQTWESKKHFAMVYLKKRINPQQLEIYLSFNDKDPDKRRIYTFESE